MANLYTLKTFLTDPSPFSGVHRMLTPRGTHLAGVQQTPAVFAPGRVPPRERPTYTCRTCNKVFLHQCNLLRHRKKCEGDYHLECHLCGKQFYRRDYYQDHLATKHNTGDVLKGSFKSKFI